MILSSIFISDEKFPLLGTPIFSVEGTGRAYVQQSVDGIRISSFERILKPHSTFLKIEGIGHLARYTNDPILYSVGFRQGWFWVGDVDGLKLILADKTYASALDTAPFLRLEIARILGDLEMMRLAAVDGAKRLARVAPQVAASWREISTFDEETSEAIDAVLKNMLDRTPPGNVAIRIFLSRPAMDALDLAAESWGANRSAAIRELLNFHRHEFDDFGFWKDLRNFIYRLNNDYFINMNFYDLELRSIVLGDLVDNHQYISRSKFHEISLLFTDRRATVRIRRDDQEVIFRRYAEEFELDVKGVEQFYGYLFLYLVTRSDTGFEQIILSVRDNLYDQVRTEFESKK
jgi:hypothetical protein